MNNSNVNQILSTSSAPKAETPKEASEAEAAMAVMTPHLSYLWTMSLKLNDLKEKLQKNKQQEEEQWTDYVEQRKKARQKEEEDLRKLKERQVWSLISLNTN